MKIRILAAFAGALMLGGCHTVYEWFKPEPKVEEAQIAPEVVAEPELSLAERAGAPLFEGMGDFHRTISTTSPDAQKYFNQGMVLSFGFNHAESIRSFRAAQTLDPDCAMCFWGEALATGPNINVTSKGKAVMSMADREAAYAAIQKAIALKDKATPQEQGLIDALAQRYSADFNAERDPQDIAWAEAIGAYVEAHPEDDDAAAIYAEALMNTMPWDYWSADGSPKPETVKVIEALETIIERSPNHPLALHLYLHAVEASDDPGRAEDEADRLLTLVPGSGHLVHMPAHIFWRVGRYDDAAKANIQAAKVDEDYIAQCNAQGFYPAMYYPHNIHFLWAAAGMSGQSALTFEAAEKVAKNVRMEQIEEFPTIEFFKTIPLLSKVQFGKWEDVLGLDDPPTDRDYSRGIWYYARGVALTRTGDLKAAGAEQGMLAGLKDTVQIQFLDTNDYPASVLLNIADQLLLGEIAQAKGKSKEAIAHFEAAVTLQDTLPYMEPPFWYYPTRQSLGEALMKAKRYAEAEAVYRRDLEEYPHNGWSMAGLAGALEKQGKKTEAMHLREHFEHVWMHADVEIDSSRL
ncbi:tetratricopeptide repeat protein [Hyphomonas sp.]|uniref:tetratricopeptide repeat protein n=1 Tax=Hyphomonas sp. TaxID=87 RepID=UPI00391B21D6